MTITKNIANLIVMLLAAVIIAGPGPAICTNVSSNTFLLVGTYTDKTAEVPQARGDGVAVYNVIQAGESGALKLEHATTIPHLYSPSFLDVTTDRRFLYTTSEANTMGQSQIHGYEISINETSPTRFQYNQIGSWDVGGVIVAHMKVDERDRFVFVSMYVCGCVASFEIDPKTGGLQRRNFLKFNESSHAHPRQDQPHLHSAILDPKFRYVYFADLGNDCVYRLDYSNEKGFDERTVVKYSAPPGSGPRHMILHPVNHNFMYVTCELNNHLVVYRVNEQGELTQLQYLPTAFNTTETSGAAGIDISPDGRFLYVSTRFADVVTVYKIDENDGAVSLVQQIDSGGRVPRNLALYSPLNALFVANQETNDVTAFRADPQAGSLTKLASWPVNTPECLKIVDMSSAGSVMSKITVIMSLVVLIAVQRLWDW